MKLNKDSVLRQKLYKVYYVLSHIVNNVKDFKYIIGEKTNLVDDGYVIVTHESELRGVSLLTLKIAEGFVNKGINVIILSRLFGPLNKLYAGITNTHIALTDRKLKRKLKHFYDCGYRKIYINSMMNGDVTLLSKKIGYDVINLIHETKSWTVESHNEYLGESILKYSDCVVYPTQILRKDIEGLCKIKSAYSQIIPQGLYLKNSKLNINKKRTKTVIAIGGTSVVKGFDMFVEIAKMTSPEIQFIWAGKRERFFYEVCKMNAYKFPPNFKYLGLVDNEQLLELYSNADVYALTSRYDTFPSVMLEAMNSGIPVIGFKNSGGIIEIVKNGVNGFLIEKDGDICSFAERISAILDIADECYKEMSDYCKDTAEIYNFENYVERLISLSEKNISLC